MKIHADILTFPQIQSCVPEACELVAFDHKNFGTTRCGYEGSRSHDRAYVVRMSGTSKYTMDTRLLRENHKSATWDEWGIFIARLFQIEPTAKIGPYKNQADFHHKTGHVFEGSVKAAS